MTLNKLVIIGILAAVATVVAAAKSIDTAKNKPPDTKTFQGNSVPFKCSDPTACGALKPDK